MYISFLVVRSFVNTVRMDGWMNGWTGFSSRKKERKKHKAIVLECVKLFWLES